MNKDTNFTSFEEGASSSSQNDLKANLIINYLPQSMNDSQLYEIFSPIGPIKTCRVIKDYKTGYSHGFGFVEYQNPQDAILAIDQLNDLPLEHKRIKVSYARPAGTEIKETNLYIQNVPKTYSVDDLENLFSEYGEIVQKNLLRDKITGLSKGVGFIRYDKKIEADAAIINLNGHIPAGGSQPLNVRIAVEHGKMKASNMAPFNSGGSGSGGGGGGGGFNPGVEQMSDAFTAGYYAGMNRNRPRGGSYNNRNLVGVPQNSRGGYNNAGGKMPFQRGARRYNPFDSRMPDMRQNYM